MLLPVGARNEGHDLGSNTQSKLSSRVCQKSFLLSFCCRGALNAPENSLLCVVGRIQSAPTVNHLIVTWDFCPPTVNGSVMEVLDFPVGADPCVRLIVLRMMHSGRHIGLPLRETAC